MDGANRSAGGLTSWKFIFLFVDVILFDFILFV